MACDPILAPILARIPEHWGKYVDCGKGWWPILVKLDQDIAKLAPDYTIAQVKEKFGGLRFYIDKLPGVLNANPVWDLIEAAEAESLATCEYCGAEPAKSYVRHGWIGTLCEECGKEYEATP